MPKEEEFIDREAIRTMKKDIARLQKGAAERKGIPSPKVAELKIGEERRKREEEEKRKRAEEAEKLRAEEEQRKKEGEEKLGREDEEERKEEEVLREREAEKIKLEEEKRGIRERIEAGKRRKEEEERKKREEEEKRGEEERMREVTKRREEERRKKEEERRKTEEEEQRKKEKERQQKEDPKYRKNLLLQEKEKIGEEKNKLEEGFKELAIKKASLALQKATLLEKLEEVEKNFQIISTKERAVEEAQRLIEEKEEAAKTPKEKKQIEKERWEIEKKREELEAKRWPLDKKIKQLDDQIKEIEPEGRKIEIREKELLKKQKEILEREAQIQTRIEGIDLEEELQRIKKLKESLEERKISLSARQNKVEEILKRVLAKEEEIEGEKKLIEEEERAAKELKKRRELEQERWGIEEKRRKTEEERWGLEEEKQEISAQLKRFEARFQTLSEKRDAIIKRLKEIEQKYGTRERAEEKKSSFIPPSVPLARGAIIDKKVIESKEEKSERVVREKSEEKERELTAAPTGPSLAAKKIMMVGGVEKIKIEEAKKRIETLKREAEERRKREEEKQRGVKEEQGREEIEKIAVQKELRTRRGKEESRIENEKLKAIKEKKIIEEEEERRKREEQMRREEERKKEEEQRRIEEVKEIAAQEQRRKELLERLQGIKKEVRKPPSPPKPPEVIRILPKKPTFGEKLWVRILIVTIVVVLLAGVGTFWYWFFRIRTQPPITGCTSDADCSTGQICNPEGVCVTGPPITGCNSDADCPTGQICNSEKICVKKEPDVSVPLSLFLVDSTRSLTISSPEELRSSLSQTLQEWQDPDRFTRLVIKNTKENKILGLKELFEGLLVRVPEGFYQKLENDFTLFIYSQAEGNRLGFVVKIKNYEGLANLLRSQETTMESDFQTFFALMGKTEAAVVSYFRSAANVPGYTGPNFRYQTLTRKDLGILYLTSGDYFVFTGSWKSMQRTVEKLGITGVRIELTTDLKFGDKGYEVELLQGWISQDPVVYPRAIVNGIFGRLTEAAVIRFQEKYASEILAPQGLSKGSGIVDSYTRIKLNELYGESGIKPRMTELTTDLRVGDHGEEVKLLQAWLAKDKKIYPQGITSGYFGYLTQQAVIRFQEKYTSEILTPQGLTRGTGIVDSQTRKKLNELYGQ